MNVLISWSGERSKALAIALKEWLPDIIQSLEVWMSDSDIKAGDRWLNELNKNLEKTNFGIICLTPENLHKDWILYEAGAISKFVANSRVVSYFLDLSQEDIKFPLAQFQNVESNKEGTLKLVQSLNQSTNNPLGNDRLNRIYETIWNNLQSKIYGIRKGKSTIPISDQEMLEEVLRGIRQLTNAAKNPKQAERILPHIITKDYMIEITEQIENDDIEKLPTFSLEYYLDKTSELITYMWDLPYDKEIRNLRVKIFHELQRRSVRNKIQQ